MKIRANKLVQRCKVSQLSINCSHRAGIHAFLVVPDATCYLTIIMQTNSCSNARTRIWSYQLLFTSSHQLRILNTALKVHSRRDLEITHRTAINYILLSTVWVMTGNAKNFIQIKPHSVECESTLKLSDDCQISSRWKNFTIIIRPYISHMYTVVKKVNSAKKLKRHRRRITLHVRDVSGIYLHCSFKIVECTIDVTLRT